MSQREPNRARESQREPDRATESHSWSQLEPESLYDSQWLTMARFMAPSASFFGSLWFTLACSLALIMLYVLGFDDNEEEDVNGAGDREREK